MIREGYLRNNYKRKISLCYPDALETGYCGALVIGKQRIKSITILDDNDKKFDVEAPLDISIEEFKRILLNDNNQPFFLEFNLDNKNKLQDLVDKS